MLKSISTLIQSQYQLMNYIDSGKWRHDEDRSNFHSLIQSVNLDFKIEIDLNENEVEYCRSIVHLSQKKLRDLNHTLQSVFKHSAQLRAPSQFVLGQLGPRCILKISCLPQLLNMFKQNQQEIVECYDGLINRPQYTGSIERINKKQSLLQMAENFKFELKCLYNECNESKSLLGEDYYGVMTKIKQIEDDIELKQILSYCFALQKLKLILKKQKLTLQQIQNLGITEAQIADYNTKVKWHASSQETDYSQEKVSIFQRSDEKENIKPQIQQPPQPQPQSTQKKEYACVCLIF